MDSDEDLDYDRHDKPGKVYKYTTEELDEIIKQTWIRDSKIDACIDKYFSQIIKLEPEYCDRRIYHRPLIPHFTDEMLTQHDEFKSLKQELCSDLETFVPDYFDEVDSSATIDDKLKPLENRIEDAISCWNKGYEEPPPKGSFQDVVVRMLADKHLQKLTETPVTSSNGPKSLYQGSLHQVLRQLRSAVEGEEATATFAYGGSIAVSPFGVQNAGHQEGHPRDTEAQEINENTKSQTLNEFSSKSDPLAAAASPEDYNHSASMHISAPVSIYWSPEGDEHAKRLSLPFEEDSDSRSASTLENLVHDCQPATFGWGDKDVLDPEYRRAGKLDTDRFSTTFHPADFGILETIEQILLPNVESSPSDKGRFRRVKAELYKLNVYSGPSGIFRKHVDTPRSQQQFGSLVVCLPSSHEGGTLLVRHNGQTVEFNWSSPRSSRIQWAAFYSDCEHEITRVTEGHRITLTYNLLITEPIGASLIPNPVVETKTFPLYTQVKSILEQPAVFKDGGVLGFFCSHTYAHNSETTSIDLPRKLKGSDMVLFAVLQSLGLLVEVLPVLEHNGSYFPRDPNVGAKAEIDREDQHDYLFTGYGNLYNGDIVRFREKGYMSKQHYGYYGSSYADEEEEEERVEFKLHYHKICRYNTDYNDIDTRWKALLMGRTPYGRKMTRGSIVGKELHPHIQSNWGGEDCSSDEVAQLFWPNNFLPGITWITSPKDEMEAITHMCYGNQASIGTRYSCAAIIAIVPPWDQRAEPAA